MLSKKFTQIFWIYKLEKYEKRENNLYYKLGERQ